MRKYLTGFCLSILFTTMAHAEDLKRAVLQSEAQYVKATVHEDRAGVEKLLCDAHTATWPSGLVHDKKGLVAALGTLYVVESLEQRDVKVALYNDDTAIVTGVEETDAKLNGKAVSTVRRFTHVWVKEKAQWKIASIHVSPIKK